MTRIIIKQGDWTTKQLSIKNKTVQTLSNGKVIQTWSAMLRQAAKV